MWNEHINNHYFLERFISLLLITICRYNVQCANQRLLVLSTRRLQRCREYAYWQGVRERAGVFETSIFFKRSDVAVLCVFSANTIACSCSMSATGAPSKALKVRLPAAKHYQLRHSCPLPNSLLKNLLRHYATRTSTHSK